jgi:Flp pilus assembly protein TadD
LTRYGQRQELVLRLLGDLLVEGGVHAEAESVFGQLLNLEPENDYAMNQLAFLSFQRGDYDEAARWMQQALEIEPGSAAYRENERMIQDRLKLYRREGPGAALDPR